MERRLLWLVAMTPFRATARVSFLGLLLGLAPGCRTVVVPPAKAPPPVLPSLESAEPAARGDLSRVVFTSDAPASVYRSQDVRLRDGRTLKDLGALLCDRTPCVAYLPRGDHEVHFVGRQRERTSTVVVHAVGEETVVNQALGRRHVPLGRTVGVLSVVLGVGLFGVAAIWSAQKDTTPETNRVLALTGLGAIAVGGTMIFFSPIESQGGATTQWSPGASRRAPDKPTVGASLGFRF